MPLEGVCGSAIDAALLMAFFSFGLFLRPPTAKTLRQASKEADEMILDVNYREIKKAMYRAREKGWLKPKELKLTKEGEDRLKGMLPKRTIFRAGTESGILCFLIFQRKSE